MARILLTTQRLFVFVVAAACSATRIPPPRFSAPWGLPTTRAMATSPMLPASAPASAAVGGGPSEDDAPPDTSQGPPDNAGRCPDEMALVDGRVCVDRWEAAVQEVLDDGSARDWSPYLAVDGRTVRAVSRPGVVPQGYISGEQAEAACERAGKRLCTSAEWLAACRGPDERAFPYGEEYERGRCNEGRDEHPVIAYYGRSRGVFTYANMNDPGVNMQPNTVAPTGSFETCVSPWGAYDMVGNLHEWTADAGGTFRGGFYVDAEVNGTGCSYATRAHGFTYHDYSTGFRCCRDPE